MADLKKYYRWRQVDLDPLGLTLDYTITMDHWALAIGIYDDGGPRFYVDIGPFQVSAHVWLWARR